MLVFYEKMQFLLSNDFAYDKVSLAAPQCGCLRTNFFCQLLAVCTVAVKHCFVCDVRWVTGKICG